MVANKTLKSTRNGGKRSSPSTQASGNNSAPKTKFRIKLKPASPPIPTASSQVSKSPLNTKALAPRARGALKGRPSAALGFANADKLETVVPHQSNQSDANGSSHCCCCCSSSMCSNSKIEANPNVDLSVVQETINLGVKNVKQVLDCVHNGTPEVKDLMMNECNLIYECKVCKNLFRSLANFLQHKRHFCLEHVCERMVLFSPSMVNMEEDEEPVTDCPSVASDPSIVNPDKAFVEPKPPSSEPSTASCSATANKSQSFANTKRKYILDCVEKLKQEQKRRKPEIRLKLSNISSNPNAVFQNLLPSSDDNLRVDESEDRSTTRSGSPFLLKSTHDQDEKAVDSPSPEEAEDEGIENTMDSESSHLSPKTKTTPNSSSSSHNSSPASDAKPQLSLRRSPKVSKNKTKEEGESSTAQTVGCDICPSTFCSKKTLRVHMQTIHAIRRLIYPCPLCCLKFKQIFNATRHLAQVHKKGKNEVKRFREIARMRAKPEPESAKELENIEDEDEESSSEPEEQDWDEDVSEQSYSSNRHDDIELKESDGDVDNKVESIADKPECVEPAVVATISTPAEPVKTGSSRRKPRCSKEKRVECTVVSEDQEDHHKENTGQDGNLCSRGCGKLFARTSAKISHERICKFAISDIPSLRPIKSKTKPMATAVSPSESSLTNSQPSSAASTSSPTSCLIIDPLTQQQLHKYADLKQMRCISCPVLTFSTSALLIQHAVLHLEKCVLKCKGCLYQTLSRIELDSHLGSVHKIPEHLRSTHMVNLSSPLNNDSNGSGGHVYPKKATLLSSTYSEEDGSSPSSSTPSPSSGLKILIRKQADRSNKKIYEVAKLE